MTTRLHNSVIRGKIHDHVTDDDTVQRPRATSSQQTNTVENLPSSDTNRKSIPASSPVISLQKQVADIPSVSCNKNLSRYYWFFFFFFFYSRWKTTCVIFRNTVKSRQKRTHFFKSDLHVL